MNEISEFFDELDMLKPKPHHIAVMPCLRRPWIRKYVWLAAGAPPSAPSSTPTPDHLLWVAVRNLSINTYRVNFECESQNGRLRFDKSDPPGYKFAVDLAAPPATREGYTRPNFTATAVAVDGNNEALEVVAVRAKAFSAGLQVGDEESAAITFQFTG